MAQCPRNNITIHSLFLPLAKPTHVKSDMTVKSETSICYYSELVLESVVDSLIRREAQLTSHKAARTTATFTISGKADFRNSIFGSPMFKERILWVVVGGKRLVVDGEIEMRGSGATMRLTKW